MQCIMALICQYFLIYTVLVVVRAWRSMSGDPSSWDNSSVVQALEATQNTVNYVPMLCVLFLATRMRAIQLSGGHTEHRELRAHALCALPGHPHARHSTHRGTHGEVRPPPVVGPSGYAGLYL